MFPVSFFPPTYFPGALFPSAVEPPEPSAPGLAPYFPRSFFPAGYFPPLYFPAPVQEDIPEPGTPSPVRYFPAGYFPPGYFPPGYFPGGAADSVVLPIALDFGAPDVYRDIEARIQALGIFAEVNRNSWSGEHRFNPPVCVIRPLSETEVQTAGAPVVLDVTCTYQLIIIVAHEEERERFDWLRTLATKCQNVLNGVRLADRTRPQFTRLRGVRHDPRAEHPIGRVTLDGTFLYEAGDRGRYEEF